MVKRSNEAKTRRHIWMADDDWERIGQIYGDSLGHSGAIQAIVRAFLKKLESQAERGGKPLHVEELDIE